MPPFITMSHCSSGSPGKSSTVKSDDPDGPAGAVGGRSWAGTTMAFPLGRGQEHCLWVVDTPVEGTATRADRAGRSGDSGWPACWSFPSVDGYLRPPARTRSHIPSIDGKLMAHAPTWSRNPSTDGKHRAPAPEDEGPAGTRPTGPSCVSFRPA